MRTIKTWLATIAILLCNISVRAYDFEADGLYYNILSASDRTVEMVGHGIYGDIVIPSSVKFNNFDFTVIRIGGSAFTNGADIEHQITSVSLPNTIESIGGYAFNSCFSLKEISIPEGVTTIEPGTFMWCEALEKIKLSDNITAIGDYAFSGCSSLKSFDLPKELREIGTGAFSNCGFTYIKLPAGNLEIGDNAFSVRIALLQPWGIIQYDSSYDGYYPFDHNTLFIIRYETQTVDFDYDGIKESTIPSYQGYGCLGMDNIVLYDSNLTDANIDYILETGGMVTHNGVNYRITSLIDTYTMEVLGGDDGITTADIVSKINYLNREFTVTSIKESAFANNTTLETVKIPNSIKSIGNNAFAGCTALSVVTTESTTPLPIKESCFDAMVQLFSTLYVPTSAVDTYKSADVWKGFGNIVSLDAAITRITLSPSSVTLTEGETLAITITTVPANADKKLISWSSSNANIATVDNTGKVTAIAPGTATITTTVSGSGVSAQCKVTVNKLILDTCATPTISYVDGKVSLTCDTDGAEVITTIEKGDDETHKGSEFEYIPTQNFTAYATKTHYENSDTVNLTICWVPCKENHAATNILTIPSNPVLISTQGGTITLNGLANGTEVAVYTTEGSEVASATATNGTATIATGLEVGTIAIVKIGGHNIKQIIK